MSDGWIKIHRRILDWEWYSDINTTRVFLHILLTAAHKPKKWRGIDLEPGQRVFGRVELARELSLSEKAIRTCLERLKKTGEVAIKTTNKFSILTIVNWEDFQSIEKENSDQTASKRPANGQQQAGKTATIQEEKKERRDIKKRSLSNDKLLKEKNSDEMQKLSTPPTQENGVFKNGNGKGFDIRHYFAGRDQELRRIRNAIPPGWDVYHLAEVYNNGVGRRGKPKYPLTAFISWCQSYTKGASP